MKVGASLGYPTSSGTRGAGSFILKYSLTEEGEKHQDQHYLAFSTSPEWPCPLC